MTAACVTMLACQFAIAGQSLALLASVLEWHASILDPRPDLAVPARHNRFVYAWWW